VLIIVLVCCTTLPILFIAHSVNLDQTDDRLIYNPKAFYMSIFFIFVVPLFIVLTVVLTWSKVNDKTKLLAVPIISGLIPLLFSMPFSNILELYKEFQPLKLFFVYGPSGVTLFYITLIWLKINYWRLSLILSSYACLFFIVPLLYLVPLRGVNFFERYDTVALYF